MTKRAQYAKVYETDGSAREVAPANKRAFDYKEIQRLVGGYYESLVPADKKCKQLYADEEGLLKQLPPNPHTQIVCDMHVYSLNGYGPTWRVRGPIIAILTRAVEQ